MLNTIFDMNGWFLVAAVFGSIAFMGTAYGIHWIFPGLHMQVCLALAFGLIMLLCWLTAVIVNKITD